jgi:hypothetical protein
MGLLRVFPLAGRLHRICPPAFRFSPALSISTESAFGLEEVHLHHKHHISLYNHHLHRSKQLHAQKSSSFPAEPSAEKPIHTPQFTYINHPA